MKPDVRLVILIQSNNYLKGFDKIYKNLPNFDKYCFFYCIVV